MAQMRLTLTHTGRGSATECTTPAGAKITFDDPDTGTHGGSPMEHVLTALGACALIEVDVILRKKRLTFTNLRVECVGTRPDGVTPRPFQDIKLVFHVDGDVPEKALDDAARLAVDKYCSVGDTLRHGAPIAHETRVHPPTG